MNDGGTVWMPEGASTLAPTIDSLFYFVYWASLVIFVGVVVAMIYLAYTYRRESHADRAEVVEENKWVELSWIIAPTILVLIVFVWGFRAFVEVGVAPPDSYEIRVTGQQWLWEFEYPDGTTTTNELHVPVDRPVKLTMSSEDVIHSFFVPAFRVKYDVLPNRYTSVWFEATKEGTYKALCTEYCGTQHSTMLANVTVESQDAFENWLQSTGIPEDASPAERGEILYEQQQCNTCHSLDGTRLSGPTFQNLYGSTETLQNGETVEVDENYLRESILQPGEKIVQGFSNVMPASYSSLSEEEVTGLVAFIKAQSDQADSASDEDQNAPPGSMPNQEASNQ